MTLQLTCTIDRHTIIWVHCAPASVCSIRTCKYTESAQNSKCRMALGETKQRVGLKGILDLGFLFQRAALSLGSDTGQQPRSGQPLTRPVPIPTEELRWTAHGLASAIPHDPSERRCLSSFAKKEPSAWMAISHLFHLDHCDPSKSASRSSGILPGSPQARSKAPSLGTIASLACFFHSTHTTGLPYRFISVSFTKE